MSQIGGAGRGVLVLIVEGRAHKIVAFAAAKFYFFVKKARSVLLLC